MKKKNSLSKQILSLVLALVMVLSMLPVTGLTAFAADTDTGKAIQLGTSGIADGDKTNLKWDYVYYGTYNNNPIKWRVLSKNGNGGTYTDNDGNSVTAPIFLLSEYVLDNVKFESTLANDGDGQSNPNDWQNSDAQAWCRNNFAVNSFSDAEKKYVLKTTKTDVAETLFRYDWGTSELQDDTAFFISAKEASDYLGSNNGDEGLVAAVYWRLRSPYSDNSSFKAGIVSTSGSVNIKNVDMFADGARPAFNLDPSSVLFTSAAESGKPEAFGEVAAYSGSEWKLTLKDDSRSGFSSSVESAVRTSAKVLSVTINYSGATAGANEYISALIKDADGNVTYYGRLKNVANTADANGTVELDLSGVTMNATDTLYIFNEQYNGDYKTDLASDLQAVTIPSEINAYDVIFDANGGTGTMDSVIVKSGETYTLPANDFTALSGYQFKGWATTKDGTVITDTKITVTADTTLYAIWEMIPAEAPTVTAGGDLTITYNGYTDEQISVSVNAQTDYTYSYQWYDGNDQLINGATDSTYTVPSNLTVGSYSYYCKVTATRTDNQLTSSADSAKITVTVNKATLTADDFNFKGPDILVFHPANFKRATITPKDGVTGVGEITVQYFDEQGQPHSYAVDAGTYTVKINVTEGANYLAAEGLTADGWTFTIAKGTQEVSWPITGAPETVYGKNDGEITGVYDEMEYRKAGETDAEYKLISGEKITGLAAGTYYVRLKETKNLLASPPVTVTIAAGRKLTIKIPSAAEQIGYALAVNETQLAWQGDVVLEYRLLDGYTETENFAIKVNGEKITLTEGRYYLNDVETDVEITVEGVADTTAPIAEMSISTNKWTQFLKEIAFGLFFKEPQEITVTATDKGSGVDKIYYLISENVLTKDAVEALANVFWEEYDESNKPSISPDKECIVYVKVIDKAQNVKVISSDGLVFDGTAPTLEGIENGKTYYGDLTVIMPADQFGKTEVTLDGETMNFAEGTYGRIPADNKEHTVVATDKAGNKTEYKITVYKVYEITVKHPTFELGFPVNYGASFSEAHPDTVQDMVAEKDHHTFIGWYESTDGGETLKDTPYDFGAKVTGDVTLYPLFEIFTYTVTYKADGQVVGTVTVEHGADATAPAIPEKEGYTQTAPAWDKDGKNITADTEINAVYTINEYTITFMDENGVYKTLTYKHGETVTMPDVPTKDGYTVKWETTIDKATGNATVKAVYAEIQSTDKPSSPQTGDNSYLALWIALLFISGGAVITLTVYDRKRKTVNR